MSQRMLAITSQKTDETPATIYFQCLKAVRSEVNHFSLGLLYLTDFAAEIQRQQRKFLARFYEKLCRSPTSQAHCAKILDAIPIDTKIFTDLGPNDITDRIDDSGYSMFVVLEVSALRGLFANAFDNHSMVKPLPETYAEDLRNKLHVLSHRFVSATKNAKACMRRGWDKYAVAVQDQAVDSAHEQKKNQVLASTISDIMKTDIATIVINEEAGPTFDQLGDVCGATSCPTNVQDLLSSILERARVFFAHFHNDSFEEFLKSVVSVFCSRDNLFKKVFSKGLLANL